jgi:hypothetical protein
MIKITSTVNKQLKQSLAAGIDKAIRKTGDHFFELVLAAADKHTKTGALVQSLNNSYSAGTYTIDHDLQRAPHAVFVHWGSRAHVIKPKARKALRWPAGGAFAFAKSVNHPGYRGDPYLITKQGIESS